MKELKKLNSSNDKKILVIVPVNRINDVFLNECAYSLAQQNQPIDVLVLQNNLNDADVSVLSKILDTPTIHFSVPKEDGSGQESKTLTAEKKLNYIIEKTEKTTFQEVFNEAFNYAVINGYEMFSVVESEDVVDTNWYSNVIKYSTAKPDYNAFLPLTREVSNGNFIGFFNEACWSEGLAEVAGVFDLQLLMRFNCMNITGIAFKTESLKEYSEDADGVYKPIKETVKISYAYEFFLRMVYNDLKFFTIPKVGYEHRIDLVSDTVDFFSSKVPRDVTSKPIEKGGMTVDEFRWYNDLAKKEYFFDEDRKIVYKAKEEKLEAVK